MSDDRDLPWSLREFKKCIMDSSYLETLIAGLAEKKKVDVPFHKKIEGLFIALRLKPPNWRLEDFCEYMDFLSFCCEKEYGPCKVFNPMMMFMNCDEHFFRLDKNLNRRDIDFMIRKVANVRFAPRLPPDFTGESIVKGELSEFLLLEEYFVVFNSIDSSRKQFDIHFRWVCGFLSWVNLGELVNSTFDLFPNDDPRAMLAEIVYPILPQASGPSLYLHDSESSSTEGICEIVKFPKPTRIVRLRKNKILKRVKKKRNLL